MFPVPINIISYPIKYMNCVLFLCNSVLVFLQGYAPHLSLPSRTLTRTLIKLFFFNVRSGPQKRPRRYGVRRVFTNSMVEAVGKHVEGLCLYI